MREESLYPYIAFGTVLRYLQDASEGWGIKGEKRVEANFKWFFEWLDYLDLRITRSVAETEGLRRMLEEMEGSQEQTLTAEQAKALSRAMTKTRTTLEAEAEQKKAFVVSPKRWAVDTLLQEPSSLFAEDVFAEIGEMARYDFQEACRCLAFERSTAAAFHILRGTEAVLRDFYCSVVKQKRLGEKGRMWHPMVEQMRKRRNPPPARLLDTLDQIRQNYRNPTQHAEAIYDIDRAQDLIGICIPAINEMVREMRA